MRAERAPARSTAHPRAWRRARAARRRTPARQLREMLETDSLFCLRFDSLRLRRGDGAFRGCECFDRQRETHHAALHWILAAALRVAVERLDRELAHADQQRAAFEALEKRDDALQIALSADGQADWPDGGGQRVGATLLVAADLAQQHAA